MQESSLIVMGEPEELDLDRLRRLDETEVLRAIRELGLFPLAYGVVHRVMGTVYASEVRGVALEAVTELFVKSIGRCYSVEAVQPLLATIARRKALNFIDRAFRRWERDFGRPFVDAEDEDLQEELRIPATPIPNAEHGAYEFLRDLLAEGLGMDVFDSENAIRILVEGAELSVVEQHLLREHVMNGVTQQAFAEQHRLPFKAVGGKKDRMLRRIRKFLCEKLRGEPRSEFRRIIRR